MADELRQRADDPMPDVTGRVALIERSVLVMLVIGLLVGVLAVVKPFTTAILFGATLATASWPIRQALVRRRLGRRTAAALLLLLALVVVVIPMLVVVPHLAEVLTAKTEERRSIKLRIAADVVVGVRMQITTTAILPNFLSLILS